MDQNEVGRKFDSEKPKMYLLPPKATLEVSKVLTFGANKYDEQNWRMLENLQNRYTGGALRHIFAHMDGELKDADSGNSHLAHAICCLLFKLEIELENEKSQEEVTRESNRREYSQSYKITVNGRESEAYNQKTGLRYAQYSVQYNPPRYDNSGFLGKARVHK